VAETLDLSSSMRTENAEVAVSGVGEAEGNEFGNRQTGLHEESGEDNRRVRTGLEAEGGEEDLETEDEQELEVEEELQETQAVAQGVKAENDDDSCSWKTISKPGRRRRTEEKECESTCVSDPSCAGWRLKMESSAHSTGRRRCNHKFGSSCAARCTMPEGIRCDKKDVVFTTDTCTPECRWVEDSPTLDFPTKLSCWYGVLKDPHGRSPAATMCKPNSVSGTLSVKHIKAYNLEDEDWFAEISDPYVALSLAGQECKTQILHENSDPQWTDPCKFSVSRRDAKLHLQVFDYDKGASDDELGDLLRIDLREVIDTGASKEYTFELNGKGKVDVMLAFSSTPSS
jgi:hypothetical protein